MTSEQLASVVSPLVGTLTFVAPEGSVVVEGATVALVESMKMEHALLSPISGVVTRIVVETGQSVAKGDLVVVIEPSVDIMNEVKHPEGERPSVAHTRLVELKSREALLFDQARPEKVARRHEMGLRTARECR